MAYLQSESSKKSGLLYDGTCQSFSYQFEESLLNVMAMHAGKGLYISRAGTHGGLKPVLGFKV